MLWRAIREDLDSLESVSDVLRVLDVVIGFLSSAGGDPEQRVSFYLYDVLKYPHPIQSKTVCVTLSCVKFPRLIHRLSQLLTIVHYFDYVQFTLFAFLFLMILYYFL